MAPKILLVGNCQVRPIEFLLRHLNNAEETNTIIVHLAKDSEREEYEHLLNSADIIVSQKIQDNYPCQTVRSWKIREEHRTKIIFIPSLFSKRSASKFTATSSIPIAKPPNISEIKKKIVE